MSSFTLKFSGHPGQFPGMCTKVFKKLVPHLGMCSQNMGEAFILRISAGSISKCRSKCI
jgi:hypothetical protein